MARGRDSGRDEVRRWDNWQALGAGFGARKRLPAATRTKTRAQRTALPAENGATSAGSALLLSATAAEPLAAAEATAEPQTAALWLHTAAEGLYRISVAELAARMTWSEAQLRRWLQNGERLALTNAGTPVAWHYEAASDSLLFVTDTYRSIHTDENAYWLVRRNGQARAMAV